MKIKSLTLGILVVAILFGSILVTSLLGWWTTESSLVPASFSDGDFEGEYNPADIRGSYAFSQVSELFNIPLQTLADAFELPDSVDPNNFYNKDLEGLFEGIIPADQEIGNASVQLFAALYNGLPFDLAEDIYLPSKAVEILKSQAVLSNEQVDYLTAHTVDLSAGQTAAVSADLSTAEPEAETHNEEDAVVKGSTTFYDLLQWGVETSQIETVINAQMPATGLLIRDYCTQNGLEFGTIKIELQRSEERL